MSRKIQLDRYTLTLFPCEVPQKPVFYLLADGERGEKIASACDGIASFVFIEGTDWNRDLSPWKAEKVFRQGEDFTGGAPDFLKVLENCLIPAAERELGLKATARGIGGYSLAGLFSLWAGYESPLFTHIASVSGSLWFDGFVDYALSRDMPEPKRNICISLGDAEHKSRNARMAQVKACTDTIAAHLAKTQNVIVQSNPGGHFNDPEGRIIRAVKAIL